MAWDFYVGQRVVCVHDFSGEVAIAYPSAAFPILGGVYTVRSVRPNGERLGLRLAEIINPTDWLSDGLGFLVFDETSFSATGFRPLDERRLDQFRAHLAPAPRQPERV